MKKELYYYIAGLGYVVQATEQNLYTMMFSVLFSILLILLGDKYGK